MKLQLTVGSKVVEKKGKPQEQSWNQLVKRFKSPIEIMEDPYGKNATHGVKLGYKQAGGWYVFGEKSDDPLDRRVKNRHGLTVDMDTADKKTWDAVKKLDIFKNVHYVLHQSFSSTEKSPKYRLVVPFAEPIELEAYEALATLVCELIGKQWCDIKSTRSPFQLMFFPVKHRHHKGDLVYVNKPESDAFFDSDAVLNILWSEVFDGHWTDRSTWPKEVKESIASDREERFKSTLGNVQADGQQKQGFVGDFCRAYTVPEVLEKFLSDKWKLPPGLADDMVDEWYYHSSSAGSDAPGGKCYDFDGNKYVGKPLIFFYSHHLESDPYAERHLNAFDLVRLHKFGELDKGSKAQSDENLPSFKAMVDLIKDDSKCRAIRLKGQMEGFVEQKVDEETGETYEEVEDPEKMLDRIKTRCVMDASGALVKNVANISYILKHELGLLDYFALNTRNGGFVLRKEWKINQKFKGNVFPYHLKVEDTFNGDYISDSHLFSLCCLLERGFNWSVCDISTSMMRKATDDIAQMNQFDPMAEYLESLEWDGKPRVGRFFSKYIEGIKKSDYTKQVSEHFFTGCVQKSIDPESTSVDVAPVITGMEGIGKSSMIAALCPNEGMMVSIPNHVWQKDTKGLVEACRQAVFVELEEFDASSDANSATLKQMLTTKRVELRLAYRRNPETVVRSWSYFCSTNESTSINSGVGERRFAPLISDADANPDQDMMAKRIRKIESLRDQLWAEAVAIYKDRGRVPCPLSEERMVAISSSVAQSEADIYADEAAEFVTRDTFNNDIVSAGYIARALYNDERYPVSKKKLMEYYGKGLTKAGWKKAFQDDGKPERFVAENALTLTMDIAGKNIRWSNRAQLLWRRDDSELI